MSTGMYGSLSDSAALSLKRKKNPPLGVSSSLCWRPTVDICWLVIRQWNAWIHGVHLNASLMLYEKEVITLTKKMKLDKIQTLSNLAGKNWRDSFTWTGWCEEITLMKEKNSLTWTKSGTHSGYSENLSSSSSCPKCTSRTDQSVCWKAEVSKPRLDSRASLGRLNPNKPLNPNKWKEKGVSCLNEY